MNDGLAPSELDWVLVLAPFRKDADYIAAFLREQQVPVRTARPGEDLVSHLALSPGILVISHEALSPEVIGHIGAHLSEQADWSEVPIFVLLERAAPVDRIRHQLHRAWPGSRLLFHTRPVAQLELVNGIQSNLLVRLRQRQVRDALERERELRLELNHRVKNILASVTSIFQMTKRGAQSVDALSDGFQGRLQALSDVHTAAFEAGGDELPFGAIVDRTVSPYNSAGEHRIRAGGPAVVVSRNAGTTLALCMHELITNAIKYGALSQPEGIIDIHWHILPEDEPLLQLEWVETGGPAVEEPTRQGYGTRYVRSALAALFGAQPALSFAPQGFRFSITGPLSRLAPEGNPPGV